MIFLFDSFDKIPEILSATDANESIREYGKAVDAFLGGLGSARAVVASRPFRGPRRLGWPVFRVLPLTPKRQGQFIGMSKLGEAAEMQMLGELPNARLELQTIPENPLFLRLLCGHVRIHAAFPANVFEVFETFAENRLQADAARIAAIFGVTPLELREFAEQAAFTMHVNAALGLSPATDRLIAALAEEGMGSAAEIRGLLEAVRCISVPVFLFERSADDSGYGNDGEFCADAVAGARRFRRPRIPGGDFSPIPLPLSRYGRGGAGDRADGTRGLASRHDPRGVRAVGLFTAALDMGEPALSPKTGAALKGSCGFCRRWCGFGIYSADHGR